MKERERILCVSLIIVAAIMPVNGTTKKRAAVMDFTANNTTGAYAKIVRNQIEVALYKTGSFEILERDKMDLILKEQGLNVTGCVDTSCAVEIGKLLSVDYVVVGSIDRLGKFLLSLKLIDVRKGMVVYADTEHAAAENDIPDGITNLAVKASRMLKSEEGKTVAGDTSEEKKKEPEKKITPAGPSNPFGIPAFGLMGLSALSLGGGYYFNMKVQALSDDYDTLAARYQSAATESEAASLHNKMSDTKSESDKKVLYRNISYGAGAAFFLASGYFFYRYLYYTPPSAAGVMNNHDFHFFPLFMAWREPQYKNARGDGVFMGGGIMARF